MNIALTQIFIDTLQSHFQIAKTFLETVHALSHASFQTVHALVQYAYVASNFGKVAPDIAESRGESPYAAYHDTAHQHTGH